MPRAFSETEFEALKNAILTQAQDLFPKLGFSGVSIDEITMRVGIAKGSFYRFFSSKEDLFFSILLKLQDDVRDPLLNHRSNSLSSSKAEFLQAIGQTIDRLAAHKMLHSLNDPKLLHKLTKKLSPHLALENEQKDAAFITAVIERWNTKPEPPARAKVSVHFAMLLMIQTNTVMLGERLYPHAESMVVKSLAACFFD